MQSEENVIIKLFTVLDLKSYFISNIADDYLSDVVISRSRAYTTIMNPYVYDDMVIISSIFVNDEVAAYTYVFPDRSLVYNKTKQSYENRLIYWNTVLYVNPKYEGRGFGSVVIGQMLEIYGDNYFDLDAVPASIENLKFAGLHVDYIEQFVLEEKKINTDSIKGRIAKFINWSKKLILNDIIRIRDVVSKTSYKLSYHNFVDDESYTFIKDRCNNNLFVRSQQMLNWILSYSFCQISPLSNRIEDKCYFTSKVQSYHKVFVQVRDDNDKLVGVYIYRSIDKLLYIEYLYYTLDFRDVVYCSIAEHILYIKPKKFFTSDKKLFEFINSYNIFSKAYTYMKSFSHPASFIYDENLYIQAGDGDNFI